MNIRTIRKSRDKGKIGYFSYKLVQHKMLIYFFHSAILFAFRQFFSLTQKLTVFLHVSECDCTINAVTVGKEVRQMDVSAYPFFYFPIGNH